MESLAHMLPRPTPHDVLRATLRHAVIGCYVLCGLAASAIPSVAHVAHDAGGEAAIAVKGPCMLGVLPAVNHVLGGHGEMLPPKAAHDLENGGLSEAIPSPYLALGYAFLPVEAAHFEHILPAQAGARVVFSRSASALLPHVGHVLGGRAYEQVLGVDAPPVVAVVTDILAWGDWSLKGPIGHPVGILSAVSAISILRCRSGPAPAGSATLGVNTREYLLNSFCAHCDSLGCHCVTKDDDKSCQYGMAADIDVRGISPREVADYLATLDPGGLAEYKTFVHCDVADESRRWGINPRR
jgi:hypothetical protein